MVLTARCDHIVLGSAHLLFISDEATAAAQRLLLH